MLVDENCSDISERPSNCVECAQGMVVFAVVVTLGGQISNPSCTTAVGFWGGESCMRISISVHVSFVGIAWFRQRVKC